jgi:hypothetical protein
MGDHDVIEAQAVDLINEAKMAADKDSKHEKLKQVLELMQSARGRFLLPALAPAILEFQVSSELVAVLRVCLNRPAHARRKRTRLSSDL